MGAAWALGALSHRRGRGTGRGHPAAEAGGSTALSVGHGSRKPQHLAEQLVTAPTEPRCRELPSRERRRRSQGRSREPLRRAWSSCRRCLSCAALETPWGTEGSCRGARCSRPPDGVPSLPHAHTRRESGTQAPAVSSFVILSAQLPSHGLRRPPRCPGPGTERRGVGAPWPQAVPCAWLPSCPEPPPRA